MYTFFFIFSHRHILRSGLREEGRGGGQHLVLVGEVVVFVQTLLIDFCLDEAAAKVAAVQCVASPNRL